jgi:hypothetical protein
VRAGRRASGRRRRVLLAVAGDERDPGDLVRTTAAVADRDGQVLVLHLPVPGDGELVERMVAGLRRCGVRARGRVDRDAAATALAYGADLIVIGSGRVPALAALRARPGA